MLPLPFRLFLDLSSLAIEANFVIALRLMKIALGGQQASAETQRMVLEKFQIAQKLAIENAFAIASGKSLHSVGNSSIAAYRSAVRANHRRLTRMK